MNKHIKVVFIFIYLACLFFKADGVVLSQEELCEAKFRHNLFSVHMVDVRKGWACGDTGVVYHTNDGGFNWTIQPINTKESLFGIRFANTETGWVVGNKGIIFQTTDGGKTWTEQKCPKEKVLFNLAVMSEEKAIACGDWGTIVYTEDGGKTWEDRTHSKDMMMYGIDFVDENEGWIAGEFGTILHTTDGGLTWEQQDTGAENTLYSISFSDNLNGMSVGMDGLIIRTRDGGQTWEELDVWEKEKIGLVTGGEGDDFVPEDWKERREKLVAHPPIFEVGYLDNVAVAAGEEGVYLISIDAGETWEQASLPPDLSLLWFRGVSLVKKSDTVVGVAVGAKAVCVTNEDKALVAIGYLPSVTACVKPSDTISRMD